MTIPKLAVLVLPLVLIFELNAQDNTELEEQETEEQLEMEKEESSADSFGNDLYNENVDPDSLKVDEEETLLPEHIE